LRKSIICIVAFAVLFLLLGCATTKVTVVHPQKIKKISRVAVLPFSSNSNETGDAIAASLSRHMTKSRYSVLTRAQLEAALKHTGLTLGQVTQRPQLLVGKKIGVDTVIAGDASVRAAGGYIEHIAECTARMIQVDSGETLLEVKYEPKDTYGLQKAATASEIGETLAKQFKKY